MKKETAKRITKLGLLVVLAIIAVGIPAKAQSLQYKLTVNVPFDFTVGNTRLVAGVYAIQRAETSSGDLVVRISSVGGRASVTGLTSPVSTLHPKDEARLVFHRYGDQYFLCEVWPTSATTGRVLPKSRSERDVQRKAQDNLGAAAMKTNDMEIVTIVASQS